MEIKEVRVSSKRTEHINEKESTFLSWKGAF